MRKKFPIPPRAAGALLFDVDGTLADTEGAGHCPAYNLAFRDLGLNWQWSGALYRELLTVAGGRERLRHYLHHYRPPLGPQAAPAAANEDAWIERVHRAKTAHFTRLMHRGAIALRPGVARLMGQARQAGWPVALVTNASRASLDLMIDALLPGPLGAPISQTVCGDEVSAKKPAPDLYLLALEKLHIPAARCLAIEDNASGLGAAIAAGIAAVVACNDDSRGQDFSGARLVVDSLGEPGAPCRVLAGPSLPAGCVDLAWIRQLLSTG